jgi:hypothetical protein
MLMHGLWDAIGAIGGDGVLGLILPLAIGWVLVATFVWIYRSTDPIEREWMHELMAPEVAAGVVTQGELEALSGTRATRRRYVDTQPSPARARRVLEAETRLARQIARDDGAETAAVQGSRAAVGRARGV